MGTSTYLVIRKRRIHMKSAFILEVDYDEDRRSMFGGMGFQAPGRFRSSTRSGKSCEDEGRR